MREQHCITTLSTRCMACSTGKYSMAVRLDFHYEGRYMKRKSAQEARSMFASACGSTFHGRCQVSWQAAVGALLKAGPSRVKVEGRQRSHGCLCCRIDGELPLPERMHIRAERT